MLDIIKDMIFMFDLLLQHLWSYHHTCNDIIFYTKETYDLKRYTLFKETDCQEYIWYNE